MLENYIGKNSMSRSQWCRHHRLRKEEMELVVKEMGESNRNQPATNTMTSDKSPIGRKPFFPKKEAASKMIPENPVNDKDMMTDDFD